MNKSLLLDELMKLDATERLDIAKKLWQSVDPDDPSLAEDLAPLTEPQMQEIRRRVEEHRKNPGSAIPWEEVRERLWSRLK